MKYRPALVDQLAGSNGAQRERKPASGRVIERTPAAKAPQ